MFEIRVCLPSEQLPLSETTVSTCLFKLVSQNLLSVHTNNYHPLSHIPNPKAPSPRPTNHLAQYLKATKPALNYILPFHTTHAPEAITPSKKPVPDYTYQPRTIFKIFESILKCCIYKPLHFVLYLWSS